MIGYPFFMFILCFLKLEHLMRYIKKLILFVGDGSYLIKEEKCIGLFKIEKSFLPIHLYL